MIASATHPGAVAAAPESSRRRGGADSIARDTVTGNQRLLHGDDERRILLGIDYVYPPRWTADTFLFDFDS